MDKIISICGLTCSECPAYIATQKNDDKMREDTAKQWSKMFNSEIKPENINCNSCIGETGPYFHYCHECEIRKCGMEKNVKNCAYCEEYACDILQKFFEMAPVAKNGLEEVRRNM